MRGRTFAGGPKRRVGRPHAVPDHPRNWQDNLSNPLKGARPLSLSCIYNFESALQSDRTFIPAFRMNGRKTKKCTRPEASLFLTPALYQSRAGLEPVSVGDAAAGGGEGLKTAEKPRPTLFSQPSLHLRTTRPITVSVRQSAAARRSFCPGNGNRRV